MPDFLTRRNGVWHFVRRGPAEFVPFDRRGIIKHSTRIRVSTDRTGRRAVRVAEQLNAALEAHWQTLASCKADAAVPGYDEARLRARSLGFEYVESGQLLQLPAERRLERLEALIAGRLENDAPARAALLGTQARPSFLLSKLIVEYEATVKDEIVKFSPNQLRVWRNSRKRVVNELVEVAGDKPVTEITQDDGLDYAEWWRERVMAGQAHASSANKSMGMLKELSIRRRLKIPEIFKGLRLKSEVANIPSPFETDFIQEELLGAGALDGLNEDARLILYILADTGLRPSELVNL